VCEITFLTSYGVRDYFFSRVTVCERSNVSSEYVHLPMVTCHSWYLSLTFTVATTGCARPLTVYHTSPKVLHRHNHDHSRVANDGACNDKRQQHVPFLRSKAHPTTLNSVNVQHTTGT